MTAGRNCAAVREKRDRQPFLASKERNTLRFKQTISSKLNQEQLSKK
jgi:hypothetical protein